MATKETQSPKVKNASRHERRGHRPNDKPVSRGKRKTGAPRINPGETLFNRVYKDRAEERREIRAEHQAIKAKKFRPSRDQQVELARAIFLERHGKCGTARREAGLDVITRFIGATSSVVNGRTLGPTATAVREARKNLPRDVESDPIRRTAALKGINEAATALTDAFDQLKSATTATS